MYITYKKNVSGRDFVIGDLHGCIDLFNKALDNINFDKTLDRIFSVGDLVDRGPSSMECLKLINEPWFHSVRGNHEDLMIESIIGLNEEYTVCWMRNGGGWSLHENQEELLELVKVANTLPYSITVDTEDGLIGICHAQPPSLDWCDANTPDEMSKEIMLWARSWIQAASMDNPDNVYKTYHGHTPVIAPTNIGSVNFIDTGAFYSGELSCIEISRSIC